MRERNTCCLLCDTLLSPNWLSMLARHVNSLFMWQWFHQFPLNLFKRKLISVSLTCSPTFMSPLWDSALKFLIFLVCFFSANILESINLRMHITCIWPPNMQFLKQNLHSSWKLTQNKCNIYAHFYIWNFIEPWILSSTPSPPAIPKTTTQHNTIQHNTMRYNTLRVQSVQCC